MPCPSPNLDKLLGVMILGLSGDSILPTASATLPGVVGALWERQPPPEFEVGVGGSAADS